MSDDVHTYRSDAVPLIKEYLWLGDTPPESPDSRPWSIARDLNIWNRLVGSGFSPSDVNGAIVYARRLSRNAGPMRLTCFYWKSDDGQFCATPFLERCIGLYHKNGAEDRSTPTGLRKAQFQDYLDLRLHKQGKRFVDYGKSDEGPDTATSENSAG